MKLRIETLTTLLMLTIILLAGCSGCAQKPKQQTPINTSPEVTQTPTNETDTPTQQEIDVHTEQPPHQQRRSPLIYQHSRGYSLYPFPRPIILPEVDKRANAEVKKRLAALKKTGDYSGVQYEAEIRKGQDIIFEEAIGTLAYAQYLCYRQESRAYPFAEKALAENPNDYETLLTWVYVYASRDPIQDRVFDFNDPERLTALRRLYEMNPDHPYVLHELTRIIYPQHPQEALGYAKKAQQLEYRYVWRGLDGVCYFQLGDYENALASFERAYAAANDTLKQGPRNKISYVKRAMNDPERKKKLQTMREKNAPLMSSTMRIRY